MSNFEQNKTTAMIKLYAFTATLYIRGVYEATQFRLFDSLSKKDKPLFFKM